jgi:hypothetical protein
VDTAPARHSFDDLYNLIGVKGMSGSRALKHRHYFRIAGITVCVENGAVPEPIKFKKELMAFSVDGPGDDNITLSHHFGLPDLTGKDLGKEVYHRAPWAIYHKVGNWIYKGILPMVDDTSLHRFAVFNADHTRAIIYSPLSYRDYICKEGFQSLSLFPTDQIWLTPLLADRSALLLHSAAAIINGRGFVFVGHSDAGKSTTMELLKKARLEQGLDTEILCDDRNVIRRWPDGWRLHGTWSHGDIADVSPSEAPLQGILFLEQAVANEIAPLADRKLIWQRLLATLIRSMVTAQWWQKELDIMENLISDASFYRMKFDKSGAIVPQLEQLSL